jgi:hypothetical protein
MAEQRPDKLSAQMSVVKFETSIFFGSIMIPSC